MSLSVQQSKRYLAVLILMIGVLVVGVSALCRPDLVGAATTQVTLEVSETFTNCGNVIEPTNTFCYRLIPDTPTQPMPAGSGAQGYDFYLTGTCTGALEPIYFDRLGIHTYTLCCISPDDPYYTIDHDLFTIEIYVDNSLNAYTVVYNEAGEKIQAMSYDQLYEFTGDLIPNDPAIMVDPPVKKTVQGTPATTSTFTFQLKADDPGNPMPSGSSNGVKTLEIQGAGEGEFGSWIYHDQGVYHYTVSEVDRNERGYIYDKTVYTITDTVTALSNGQLVVDRVVENMAHDEATAFAFTNTYDSSLDAPSFFGQAGNGVSWPKTGDLNNPFVWAAVMAFGVSFFVILWRRRQKDEEERHVT